MAITPEDEEFKIEELSDEERAELRRKIQIGVEAMQQGQFTTYRTDDEIRNLADEIIREGMEKMRQSNRA